jgi:hypothetical protein
MRVFSSLLAIVILGAVGFAIYQQKITNPEVAKELRAHPEGARAQRVMLMTIDQDNTLPVNYLREGSVVYVGADGPWWRDLTGEGQSVALLIKGEVFAGQARAVVDRPGLTKEVFKRLRPSAPEWLPDWLNGVLVIIDLREV